MDKEELAIIYEDNHIIVVIKPQNTPTQGDVSGDPDLLNQIKEYLKLSKEKAGEAFVGMVHRLDRVTGGVMVFAKTSKAASRLSLQLKDGRFEKKYLAVVVGTPKQRSAKLQNYLLKDEKSNKVSIVGQATEGAKKAELEYTVRELKEKISLVEVDLITGRSHQIRAQLSNIGVPIFGDVKYGGKGSSLCALWAYQLCFEHPTTKDRLKFVVNPPESNPWSHFDFNRKEHKLRGGEN